MRLHYYLNGTFIYYNIIKKYWINMIKISEGDLLSPIPYFNGQLF